MEQLIYSMFHAIDKDTPALYVKKFEHKTKTRSIGALCTECNDLDPVGCVYLNIESLTCLCDECYEENTYMLKYKVTFTEYNPDNIGGVDKLLGTLNEFKRVHIPQHENIAAINEILEGSIKKLEDVKRKDVELSRKETELLEKLEDVKRKEKRIAAGRLEIEKTKQKSLRELEELRIAEEKYARQARELEERKEAQAIEFRKKEEGFQKRLEEILGKSEAPRKTSPEQDKIPPTSGKVPKSKISDRATDRMVAIIRSNAEKQRIAKEKEAEQLKNSVPISVPTQEEQPNYAAKMDYIKKIIAGNGVFNYSGIGPVIYPSPALATDDPSMKNYGLMDRINLQTLIKPLDDEVADARKIWIYYKHNGTIVKESTNGDTTDHGLTTLENALCNCYVSDSIIDVVGNDGALCYVYTVVINNELCGWIVNVGLADEIRTLIDLKVDQLRSIYPFSAHDLPSILLEKSENTLIKIFLFKVSGVSTNPYIGAYDGYVKYFYRICNQYAPDKNLAL